MIGCSILSSMLQEYATTVKSSDVGLPWEVHFKAKKQFEVICIGLYLLNDDLGYHDFGIQVSWVKDL
jgi:hypothetical protein